mmetsp:Transcript_115024/g.325814  ORF Transcript_115024/g.325814 Transcript_115024/m.325814 type:complete len:827 (-) Transcript_115024:20-2500(-)
MQLGGRVGGGHPELPRRAAARGARGPGPGSVAAAQRRLPRLLAVVDLRAHGPHLQVEVLEVVQGRRPLLSAVPGLLRVALVEALGEGDLGPADLLSGDLHASAPDPLRLEAYSVDVAARALLVAVDPLPAVDPAVGPRQRALAVLQVLGVTTLVHGAVGPLHPALPGHLAPEQLAGVHPAVVEDVASATLHLILLELSLVLDLPHLVRAGAVLDALHELPLVPAAVLPGLLAPPGLLVLLPLALVGVLVRLDQLAVPVRPALVPLALVPAAVRRAEDAVAVHLGADERAVVLLAVRPLEDPFAMPVLPHPLAGVQRAGAPDLHLHLPLLDHRVLEHRADALRALGHALEEPRREDRRLRRAHRLPDELLPQPLPVLLEGLEVPVGVQLGLYGAAVQLLGEPLAVDLRHAHVLGLEVLVGLLHAVRELGAGLLELGVVAVEPGRGEDRHGLLLGGLVVVAEQLLGHREVRGGAAGHVGLVGLDRLLEADAQLLPDHRGPGRLDGGHGAVVDGVAVLLRQDREHGAGHERALDRLRLHRLHHRLHEAVDLLPEGRPQRLERHLLDVPQLLLLPHRPAQGDAVALPEEVLDDGAELVLVILAADRAQRVLEVLGRADQVLPLVHELQVEVAQHPQETREVVRDLRVRQRVHPSRGAARVDPLREVQDQVQVVKCNLVNRTHRVVDEVRREEDAEGEDLHVAAGGPLRRAEALGVHEDAVVVRAQLHGLAPDPEAFGAGVHGGADLEAVLHAEEAVQEEGLPRPVEPRDADHGDPPAELVQHGHRVPLQVALPAVVDLDQLEGAAAAARGRHPGRGRRARSPVAREAGQN